VLSAHSILLLLLYFSDQDVEYGAHQFQQHQNNQEPLAGRQTFSVPPAVLSVCGTGGSNRISVPVGHWKDDFWDLFRHGYCHASAICACCCVPCATGQVISRLHLTWLGLTGGTVAQTTAAFKTLFYLTWSYWALRAIFMYIIYVLDPNVGIEWHEWKTPGTWYYVVCAVDDMLWYMYLAFSVVVLRNTRSHLRKRYAIPESEQCPTGCEDVCCSIFCPCFVVAQMMRHTADYDSYRGQCCSETGLPLSAPEIV
jgi:PLAC8 family